MKPDRPPGAIRLPHTRDRLAFIEPLTGVGMTLQKGIDGSVVVARDGETAAGVHGSGTSNIDGRGCGISGANPVALEAYERALATYQSWRSGFSGDLHAALLAAPGFVMAHVLRAWVVASNRDPQRVHSARMFLARADELPANETERLHLAAIAAVLADDYELAKTKLGEALALQPRDVLALQMAHAFDYLTGDTARMLERVQNVLPAWSSEVPGYHAVLAMHAFSLEECGEYGRAEQAAQAALTLNPADARAHHAMTHVFEMTARPAEGLRWMREHIADWSNDTLVATHCWWHMALFHMALGQIDQALALYDRHLRGSHELADLIDATSLLWRVEMRGGSGGKRWPDLSAAWAPHIDDAFCSFSDLHAMLAFIGARQWSNARRLERAMRRAEALPTRYGGTTRQIGLPAARALIAFGRGDDTLAANLLRSLPPLAQLGGSHAQRDVLQLTLLRAIGRARRAAPWLRLAHPGVAAHA